MKIKKTKLHGTVVYTIVMLIALICTLAGVITYMLSHSEKEAAEHLRLEAVKFKNSINIQLRSDMETLRAMASLVSERFADEASYRYVCKQFESFGFCENIGILVPGDKLITKHGSTDVSGKLSFEKEALRGEYISGRVSDMTNPDKQVIRSAVPITAADGQVMAMLYGTMDVQSLNRRYVAQSNSIDAYLCIVESGNGQVIFDTKNTTMRNITSLAGVEYRGEYSYDKFVNDLTVGNSGYTAFIDNSGEEFLYVRYGAVGIADWRIMLAQPESVIFAGANATIKFLVVISLVLLFIMTIYILCVLSSLYKLLKINSSASAIRKSLLEINQRSESLTDALRKLTEFAKSRSAVIIDAYNEEHHYILPEDAGHTLLQEELEFFNNKLVLYAARHRDSHGASVNVSKIRHNEALKQEMFDLYEFMTEHDMQCIKYAVVINNNSNIYLLAVINPKSRNVLELLKKVAVCISMAVYNDKHLKRTERMALTDSLTGIANRMAFNRDVKQMRTADIGSACIYIDVNELHFFNNKYGHAAGDQMIIFIAETLGRHFRDSSIYRMGGDEFLILCDGIAEAEIKERLVEAIFEIEEMKYHIAVGMKLSDGEMTVEEMVNCAEQLMYDQKTNYYRDKELRKVKDIAKRDMMTLKTGVQALDACLSVMTLRYLAVYCVSFDKDSCIRILAPSYFSDFDDENGLFSTSLKRYFNEFAKPEYHRALLSFIDYGMIERALKEGNIPSITYERIDGERVILKVYPIDKYGESMDAVWIFEKE